MTTVVAFIFMFGLLVFVHEWGHLIFAKRAGMLAREFAIGFGPKIFSFTRNETLYTIRLLPVGGYVRVAGDDPEIIEIKPGYHIGLLFNEAGLVDKIIVNNKDKHPDAHLIEVNAIDLDHDLYIDGYELDNEEEVKRFKVDPKAFFVMDETETQIAPYDRQFASKSVGQRAMQLFAGPMMNFILAIILFIAIGLVQGTPSDDATIGDVISDSPAEAAGFLAGDTVVEVNGKEVSKWEDFTSVIQANPNEEVDVKVNRSDEIIDLTVTPDVNYIEQTEEEIGQVGVQLQLDKSVTKAFTNGLKQTYETSTLILDSLGKLITGQYSIDMLSGPVGIYDATDQVVKTGFLNFVMWTAILSVNLGIINLVPLPALDGGRLLFVGIEAVRGKPVKPQHEGAVHVIGFMLLMLLMLVVTWNDIQRLFM